MGGLLVTSILSGQLISRFGRYRPFPIAGTAIMTVAVFRSTLFRQIGGSIGVSAFGAIFANRLGGELAAKFPPGTHIPTAANPEVVKHLPAAIHTPYIQAFASALQPVFLTATGVALLAFLLSWLLRELALRSTTATSGAGAPVAGPKAAVTARPRP
jgi:hypothetical protein